MNALLCCLFISARSTLSVGYFDVVSVKDVLASVSAKFQREVESAQRELHFGPTPIKRRWYTQMSRRRKHRHSSPGAAASPSRDAPSPVVEFKTRLDVCLEQLDILVVDDSGVSDKRLISLTTTLDATVQGISLLGMPTSGDLDVRAELYIAAACFNDNVSAWEPIIDPIQAQSKARRDHMWCLALEVQKTMAEPGATEVAVNSETPLTLTVTHHFLTMLSNSAFARLAGGPAASKRIQSMPDTVPVATPPEQPVEKKPSSSSLTAPTGAVAPASEAVSLGQNASVVAFAPEATTHNSVPVAPANATIAALRAVAADPTSTSSAVAASGAMEPVGKVHSKQQTNVPYLTVKNCSGIDCVISTQIAGMASVEVGEN